MLQRPHFLPKVSPSSVAQTAHRVRIILYMVKSLGQPYDAKCLQKGSSCLLASVLQAASARDFLNAGALEAAPRGRDLLKLLKG